MHPALLLAVPCSMLVPALQETIGSIIPLHLCFPSALFGLLEVAVSFLYCDASLKIRRCKNCETWTNLSLHQYFKQESMNNNTPWKQDWEDQKVFPAGN